GCRGKVPARGLGVSPQARPSSWFLAFAKAFGIEPLREEPGMLDLTDFQFEPNLARAATMPARWYIAPEFLALEKDKIFARTWQAVGRIDEVARAGDFFTCEVLGEPLVVTRGTDGVLRAFYNVCRHRAGNVAAGKGNRKSL